MHKIFLVEDDEVIASVVSRHLQSWGFEVGAASDFADVMGEFAAFAPQLVLMDISLPFYNGYHWCTEIRKVSAVPVVFLSSASDSMNIVMAMNMGGDDFVAKPFSLEVLTAKIQAVLRRAYDIAPPARGLSCRGAVLDEGAAVLEYEGKRIDLTRNECRILYALLEARGAVVSRDELMRRLWESDSFVDENALTVNIARLRRKLESAGLADFIRTKKGLGYLVE
jgi:two-component system response regulator protein BraR/BceR